MAMITYPLNDVEYTAEDAELYNCTRTSGVYSGEDFSCTVSGTNNNVTIGEGVGWISNSRFSGKVFANKAPVTLALDIADAANPRIDIVAVRFDAATNTTDLVIKKGTAAASPVMPEIVQTESVYELYLYSVYRETAATAITADNVTDLRLDASVCGLMADAVSSVDTSAINAQFTALLAKIKQELADLKVDKIDAYTREETLSPTTKTALGLSEDAVPDDVFGAIFDKTPKIGDVLSTIRTDLGDDWLLANGDTFSATEYPKLAELRTNGTFANNVFEKTAIWTGTNQPGYNVINRIIYTNGYWVVVGQAYDGATYYARLAYSTSLGGPWTVKDLWSGTNRETINDIIYADGKWVVCGNAESYRVQIAYATSLDGIWETKIVWSSSWSAYGYCIAYANGYWVVGGKCRTSYNGSMYAYIAYTTSLEGTWSTDHIHYDSTSAEVRDITYANGYWVASIKSSDLYTGIGYATSLDGTWTVKGIGTLSGEYANVVKHINGLWIVGANYYTRLYYASSPEVAWQLSGIIMGSSGGSAALSNVIYWNGLWVAVGADSSGDAQIAWANELDGTWARKDIENIDAVNDCIEVDNQLVLTGRSSADAYEAVISLISDNVILPTITIDNAYTYIKAKE